MGEGVGEGVGEGLVFSHYTQALQDWSTLFSSALGNERTLVSCKSCEARSPFQIFRRDQCPFISQYKQKSVFQSLYLCKSDEKPLKSRKN